MILVITQPYKQVTFHVDFEDLKVAAKGRYFIIIMMIMGMYGVLLAAERALQIH